VKSVFAFQFHVHLRLCSVHTGDQPFADTTTPFILGFTLRVLFWCRFPTHSADLCVAESAVCTPIVQLESPETFFFLGFFIVVFALFLLWCRFFLRCGFFLLFRCLFRNDFFNILKCRLFFDNSVLFGYRGRLRDRRRAFSNDFQ
jgi:hypothetical protein